MKLPIVDIVYPHQLCFAHQHHLSFALIGITFTLLVLGVFIIIITTNIITMITWSSPPPPPRWPCASALPWSGSPSPSWCWGSSSATTQPRWSGLAAGRKLVLLEKWPRPKYSDKTFQRIELCPTGWPPALLLCYILAGAQVSSICFITGHIAL